MDHADADAVLHNAVGYAQWCELRAVEIAEGRDPCEVVPEMLRRSAEQHILIGVMVSRMRAPWWLRAWRFVFPPRQ